jgi:hypothetical protein
MISDIVRGDITNGRHDIIIGMNSTLADVKGIGLPFIKKIAVAHPIQLGSVLSFDYRNGRRIHMIICHHIGRGGWKGANTYVRFGMDFLWHTDRSENKKRPYGIVRIGRGRVGCRDGADHVAIHTAMADSFLPVILFHFDPEGSPSLDNFLNQPDIHPTRVWSPSIVSIPARVG